MKSPFVRGLVLGVLVAAIIGMTLYKWLDGGRPEPAPIPPAVLDEMVPIDTQPDVDESEPSAVEKVRIVTRPGQPDPAAVRALALQLCGSTSPPRATSDPGAPFTSASSPEPERGVLEVPEIHARISFDATKHVGLDDSQERVVAGWVGQARFETSPSADGPWSTFYAAPFDQSTSVAVSELTPRQMLAPRELGRIIETAIGLTTGPGVRGELRAFGHGNRWGWWAAVDWIPDPETYTTATASDPDYDRQIEYRNRRPTISYASDESPTWILAAGVARRWGKP